METKKYLSLIDQELAKMPDFVRDGTEKTRYYRAQNEQAYNAEKVYARIADVANLRHQKNRRDGD